MHLQDPHGLRMEALVQQFAAAVQALQNDLMEVQQDVAQMRADANTCAKEV
jgi:hypothetical protein